MNHAPDPPPAAGEITAWLKRWGTGDDEARQVVFDLVYHELKRTAADLFRDKRQGHTLQPRAESQILSSISLGLPCWKDSPLATRCKLVTEMVGEIKAEAAAQRPLIRDPRDTR